MQTVMQDLLKSLPSVQDALRSISQTETENRGAIFTRREIVDFMLDLAGYTPELPLHQMRLLEPSAGAGDFLFPAVGRLMKSFSVRPKIGQLIDAIRAVEIHHSTWLAVLEKLTSYLEELNFTRGEAEHLANHWLLQEDFLLADFNGDFTHVVGNPPYVRQELIPAALLNEYRSRFQTIYDRADLYVPFIEKSLASLAPNGVLTFICSDRWMKNKYGAPLRAFVSERFHLEAYVDMVDTNAFQSEVIAYPAITVIRRSKGTLTRAAHRPQTDPQSLSSLAKGLLGKTAHPEVSIIQNALQGSAPWILHSPDQTQLVRRLEQEFPTLQEAGCRVGIGVATGADKVYVGKFEELPVETECKLPLAMTRDILSGNVIWSGHGVINPFGEDGRLINLEEFPRLSAYLKTHEPLLRSRNCAKKSDRWYRTIDRIIPSLTLQPKLLIPDIKGHAHVVFEAGCLYPHHNLYYLTSKDWNLHALQALLLSGIAQLFVAAYSVQMAGGFLRFQAQYLRRIRLPLWQDISTPLQQALTIAGQTQNRLDAREIIAIIYQLTKKEQMELKDTRRQP